MSMPPTLPPQGWYPDPEAPSQQRWWDGQAWGPKAPPTAPTNGVGGFLGQVERQVESVANDPGGFYHQHEKGINEAGGAALLAEGLGVMPRVGRGNGGPISALIGVVVGIVFVVSGFFIMSSAKPPAGETATAIGTVSALNMVGSTCSPNATFVVAGKTYTAAAASVSSSGSCSIGVGSAITVYYNPSNPTMASVKASSFTKMFGLLFMGVGAIFAVGMAIRFVIKLGEVGAGGALLLKGLRQRKTQ